MMARARCAATAALIVPLLAGCVLTGSHSEESLARVGTELTDADSIYAELGNANLVRENGRLWIYAWPDRVWISSLSLLALEFDDDGKLLKHELARAVRPDRSELDRELTNYRYCTPGGTCIEHGIDTDEGLRFDGAFSAVSVRGAARTRLRPTSPRPDECVVVIWPGHGWHESHSTSMAPYGIALSIDGAPRWTCFRWVPDGAFARMELPAGDHLVSVRDPVWDQRMADQETAPDELTTEWWVEEVLLAQPPEQRDLQPSTAPFHCWSGEVKYLKVDAAFVEKGGEHWFPIVMHSLEATEAQAVTSRMSQVLPPDH